MRKLSLNKPSGNMYHWAWTISFIGGECKYKCGYCYVKEKIAPWLNRMGNPKYYGEPCLIEKELKVPLTKPDDGNVIFIESCGDMFGDWVPRKWILKILDHCKEYADNTYLFQTKNPARFFDFENMFPPNTIYGTTLETNRDIGYHKISKAPSPSQRMVAFHRFVTNNDFECKSMISIEPLLNFDLDAMVEWVNEISPSFVSIGADSITKKFLAPSFEKTKELINELEGITEVRIKANLQRLFKKEVI